MTFNELKAVDKEDAFQGWLSVSHAKTLGYIPKKFFPYFDDFCECGSENIIKGSLSMMTCCNPRCVVKQGYALAEMFTRFGIKGLKEATCRKAYAALKAENERCKQRGEKPLFFTDSYVAVLAVPWEKYPYSLTSTVKGQEFYQACCNIMKQKFTFAQLVSNLAIPSIGSAADKLMEGINSPEELLSEIKKCGTVFGFCINRGFRANNVAFNLRNSLMDIAAVSTLLKDSIKHEGLLRFSVCMTGIIIFNGSKTTKDRYIAMCNDLCTDSCGTPVVEIKMTAAMESNPFILYSRPSGDRKYSAGLSRGVVSDYFGTHPVLMNVDTFYVFLKEVMTQWEKERSLIGAEKAFLKLQEIFRTSMISIIAKE